MKKRTPILMVAALCLVLAGCGNDQAATPTEDNTGAQTVAEQEPQQSDQPSIEIVSERLDKYVGALDDPTVDYFAEIKNTGNCAVKLENISIELNSVDGSLIEVRDYIFASPNTINPGESAYIVETLYNSFSAELEGGLDNVGEAKLQYTLAKTEPREELPIEILEGKIQKDGYNQIKALGRAQNNGTEDLQNVDLLAIIRDKNGVFQNEVFTILENIPAGQATAFSQGVLYGDPELDYTESTVEFIIYPGW